MSRITAIILLALIGLTGLVGAGQALGAGYDQPRLHRVMDCLSLDQEKGPHHRVGPVVRVSGDEARGQIFFNFELETAFGVQEVESLRLLKIRIHEAKVLAATSGETHQTQIIYGLGNSLKQMGVNFVDAVSDPVGTVKAVPEWFGKMFNRARGVAGYEHQDRFQHQDTVLEGTLIGGWKRQIAYDLQVDPYTNNPPLRELLQEMAAYKAAGGNLVRVASWFVSGPATLALQAQRLAGWQKQLRDFSAGDLAIYNNQRLLGWGLSQEEADAFQDNPILSPAHKTVTLNCVDLLEGVEGRLLLLKPGREAKTEAQAIHLTLTAVHLLGYHQQWMPLKSISLVDGLFVCRDAAGQAVIPYLSDWLPWTRTSAKLFQKASAKAGKRRKILIHEAKISPLAEKNLEKKGFTFMATDLAVPDQAADFMPPEMSEPVPPRPDLPPERHPEPTGLP